MSEYRRENLPFYKDKKYAHGATFTCIQCLSGDTLYLLPH